MEDLHIQTDNDNLPISLLKNVYQNDFTDEYNFCNRRRDTKYNMFHENKRLEWV